MIKRIVISMLCILFVGCVNISINNPPKSTPITEPQDSTNKYNQVDGCYYWKDAVIREDLLNKRICIFGQPNKIKLFVDTSSALFHMDLINLSVIVKGNLSNYIDNCLKVTIVVDSPIGKNEKYYLYDSTDFPGNFECTTKQKEYTKNDIS